MRVGNLLALLLLSSTTHSSCSTRRVGDLYGPKHAEGTAGVAANEALWFPFYPDLDSILGTGEFRVMYRSEVVFELAESKPELARLQNWLDAMYALATDSAWFERTGRRPLRPKVVVIRSDEPNAFMHSAGLQYPLRIVHIPPSISDDEKERLRELANQDIPPESLDAQVAKIGLNGGISFSLSDGVSFMAESSRNQEFLAYQRSAARRLGSPCYVPDTAVTEPFELQPSCVEAGVASHAELRTTLPYMFIHSALIEDLSELETVGVIAHELGHYLYGHPTEKSFLFGYRQSISAGVSPDLMAANDRLGVGYYYIENQRTPDSVPKPISDPDLIRQAQSAIRDFEASAFLKAPGEVIDSNVVSELVFIPSLSISDGETRSVVSLEEFLTQSCDQIKGEQACAPLRHSFSLRRSEAPYWSDPRYPAGLKILSDISVKIGIGSDDHCMSVVSSEPTLCSEVLQRTTLLSQAWERLLGTSRPSLRAVLENAERLASEARARKAAGKKWLIRNRVSWYTPEQQADEFMVEVLSKMGIDPWIMVERYAKKHEEEVEQLSGKSRASTVGDDLIALNCRSLVDAKFRDQQGDLLSMGQTLGLDWGKIHHSPCYRAYNIAREMAVLHDYKLAPMALEADSGVWTALQSSVRTLLK